MENRPSVDRGLLIPILIGAVSLIGIVLVFSIATLARPRAPAPLERTATPFKYLLLATETGTSNPELETPSSEETFPADVIFPSVITGTADEFITFPPQTPSRNGTPINDVGLTPTAATISPPAPTVAPAQPLSSGKYDDSNPNIRYDSAWTIETNLSTVYLTTLHVSTTIGNEARFRFVGQQMYLGYQHGLGFGTVVITIDQEPYLLTQTAGNIWISPQLTSGEHSVIIIHESEDSINIDYITILGEN